MEQKPKVQLREGWLANSAIYSLACILVPVTIYSSDSLFKRFCGFHNRVLKLQNKSPRRILFMALCTSIVYSSITLNLYYIGLMKIMGISSIYDIEGIISNEFKEDEEKKSL